MRFINLSYLFCLRTKKLSQYALAQNWSGIACSYLIASVVELNDLYDDI